MDYHALLIAGIFIAFDVITGIIKGWKNGTINSTKMREGLINKIIEIVAILFGFVCEYTLPTLGVGVDIAFGHIISVYIILTEIVSIIENFGAVSPAVGKVLSGVFEKVNPHAESEEENAK